MFAPQGPSSMFPKRVWIAYGEEDQDMGYWQYCDYEQLPDLCSYCKKVGHSKLECKVFDKMYEKDKNSKQGKQRAPKPFKLMNQEGKQQPKSNSYTSNKEKGKEKQINKERDMQWKEVWKRKKANEGGHSSGLSIQEKDQAFKTKSCVFLEITSSNRLSKQTGDIKLTPEITVHNRFEVLNEQSKYQANNQGTKAHTETENEHDMRAPFVTQMSTTIATKEIEREEEFLADQRAFLTAQEIAKFAGPRIAKDIQIPIQTAPIRVCIQDPVTLRIQDSEGSKQGSEIVSYSKNPINQDLASYETELEPINLDLDSRKRPSPQNRSLLGR